MKKLTVILMALVLVLGLAQCKKNNVEEKNLVNMTLTASANTEKVSISSHGTLKWEAGDTLNVVVNGVVRGTLCASSASLTSTFTGQVNMEGLTEGTEYTFYFYYIGGHGLDYGMPNTTMSISGQSGTAGTFRNFYIASGSATATYNAAGIEVGSTILTPYTSVVKVNRVNFCRYNETNEHFYMYGDNVYESVEIDFSDNTFTPMNANRYIHIGNSLDRDNLYYTLLPAGNEEVTLNFVNKRTSSEIRFRNGIQSGKFYCDVNNDYAGLTVEGGSYAQGSLRGLFTVADGTLKHFSQGNLQATYDGNWAWAFAPRQYDAITGHTANTSIIGIMSVSENGSVDLFGWNSTNGISTNGINNSVTPSDYGTNTELADWGGLIGNGWFTPNRDDWDQIFNERTVNEHRYTMVAIVKDDNSVARKGMILFPDNYSNPGVALNGAVYDAPSAFAATVHQTKEWPVLEAAGCVFLPLTCYREGTDVTQSTYGVYWSSTFGTSQEMPLCWQFGTNASTPGGFLTMAAPNRYRGCAVRLMCD